MKRLTILILTILCIACDKKEEEISTDTFEVTTAGIGVDCKLILIDFKEGDLDRIKKITGSNWLRYQAYNLEKSNFSDEGQILTVKVRKTLDSELFACTTLGPGYPWVTVLEAKLKK
jgi:hypothetical protein